MLLNKKAQYEIPQRKYTSVSPILVLGIALFAFPYISPVFGMVLTGFVKNLFTYPGLILIFVGSILSILNASNF